MSNDPNPDPKSNESQSSSTFDVVAAVAAVLQEHTCNQMTGFCSCGHAYRDVGTIADDHAAHVLAGLGLREERTTTENLSPPRCCGHDQGCHECGLCQVVINNGPAAWSNPVFCPCVLNDSDPDEPKPLSHMVSEWVGVQP